VNRRPSRQTVTVLRALASNPVPWRYGYELGQEVGLKAGTLYPILIRLCDRGLLESSWETDAPPGRPPRHLYRLTGAGSQLAAEVAAELEATAEPAKSIAPTKPARDRQPRKQPRSAW
jgi:PadR family transcriptional regulator, regulatory protein PadR